MMDNKSNNRQPDKTDRELAEQVRNACIKAASEGFQDASISGLCSEGAMEAAISAMQLLDLNKLLKRQK